MKTNRKYLDEHETIPEIVYCRAVKCVLNEGNGKCRITRLDDKISVDSEGRCVQFSCG